MVRGTRLLIGPEADLYFDVVTKLRAHLRGLGFGEVYLPSLWDTQTFVDKAGPEIIGQMYSFKDKGDRDLCLIPECTAVVQKMWNDGGWKGRYKWPLKIFYIQRCYRYERPQAGRYREFTQAGIEILGGRGEGEDADYLVAVLALRSCLDMLKINYTLNSAVKRGLSYYVEDGFEAEVASLGAQKQVAGGGRYKDGIGWGIGVDRLMLALGGSGEE